MKYNYENYWEDSEEERKRYYDNLYSKVKDFYNFQKDKKVLDVAGGSGQLSNFFGLKKVTLIDISDSGLQIAKKRFHFNIRKCDLVKESWPTRGKKYDYVLCNEFLEHIHHPSIILCEINESLKEGGILYIGQPNMRPDGEHHVRRINYSYLKFILGENGFKIKIKSTKSTMVNIKIFIGATIGIFIPNKLKYSLAKKFPNVFRRILSH